ncbi:hypothetical protein ABZX30_18560 [Streptomyces sp. NPDC004542]|uniref:hypothetical protein n=1 Tax=Streptomyces sp. NPDC004542 TaxID=3154281 RepID=UPI00339FF36F
MRQGVDAQVHLLRGPVQIQHVTVQYDLAVAHRYAYDIGTTGRVHEVAVCEIEAHAVREHLVRVVAVEASFVLGVDDRGGPAPAGRRRSAPEGSGSGRV